MNEAVKRFLNEMGEGYASEGDRDVSPILFKADDMNGGTLFELTLPKGEPHPYWCVRERVMTASEVTALIKHKISSVRPRSVGSMMGDMYRVRGYVYNARARNKWNVSVDAVEAV